MDKKIVIMALALCILAGCAAGNVPQCDDGFCSVGEENTCPQDCNAEARLGGIMNATEAAIRTILTSNISVDGCWDSDGASFGKYGFVKTGTEVFFDYCRDSDTLLEIECSGNVKKEVSQFCIKGCKYGICQGEVVVNNTYQPVNVSVGENLNTTNININETGNITDNLSLNISNNITGNNTNTTQ